MPCVCKVCVVTPREVQNRCSTPGCQLPSDFHRPGEGYYCDRCWRNLVRKEMPERYASEEHLKDMRRQSISRN